MCLFISHLLHNVRHISYLILCMVCNLNTWTEIIYYLRGPLTFLTCYSTTFNVYWTSIKRLSYVFERLWTSIERLTNNNQLLSYVYHTSLNVCRTSIEHVSNVFERLSNVYRTSLNVYRTSLNVYRTSLNVYRTSFNRYWLPLNVWLESSFLNYSSRENLILR